MIRVLLLGDIKIRKRSVLIPMPIHYRLRSIYIFNFYDSLPEIGLPRQMLADWNEVVLCWQDEIVAAELFTMVKF